MGNHYHLLVETPQANISDGMRHLNGIYTQRFNRRYSSIGHLFQGRFKSMLIDGEAYLLDVARYIVLNPHRAGLSKTVKEWKWSSYRATAGFAGVPDFLTVDAILKRFSGRRSKAMELYTEFVDDGIIAENPFKNARGGALGSSDKLLKKIREALDGCDLDDEKRISENRIARPGLGELFAAGERDINIGIAVNKHRYKLKEVGDFLGLHRTTISKIATGKQSQ
jgi:hypothetical protein